MSSCRGTGNHSPSPRTKPPPDCCGAGRPVTLQLPVLDGQDIATIGQAENCRLLIGKACLLLLSVFIAFGRQGFFESTIEPLADPLDQGVGNDRTAQMVQKKQQQKDRKSTRLNSSHVAISYAVVCLKKK